VRFHQPHAMVPYPINQRPIMAAPLLKINQSHPSANQKINWKPRRAAALFFLHTSHPFGLAAKGLDASEDKLNTPDSFLPF